MTTDNIKDKFAILVVSCDKYSDLWEPFFELFSRFWPDCPYNIYLLTNNVLSDIPKITTLRTGEDISWSDNLNKAVSQLKEEYILLFLEDLFLYDFVKEKEVMQILNWMIASNANYIRMNPTQPPDKKFNELIGIVSKGTIYRASTVLSVWKKSVLMDLLKPGENAWDFEIKGTKRSDKYDGFYSARKDLFPVINGVVKGKWERGAVKKMNSLGVTINLSKRKIMSYTETIKFHLKWQVTHVLNLFPAGYRQKIKDILLRGKYDYKTKI
jgi:hypothetical protein